LASEIALEWSVEALADLDRFAAFLREHHPHLAAAVAREIIGKAAALRRHPRMGRRIVGRDYRQITLRVLNADYVFQYRLREDKLVVLRVFHARAER